jgi:hypothetical protein
VFWGLSRQGEGSKGVHDEVHPEHLNGVERCILKEHGSEENDEHRDDVDGELELEELPHIVVNTAAVLQSDDDGTEVVIHKDDVRGALGDVSTGNTHCESNICLSESGSIVSTVTSHGDNISHGLDTGDKKVLVLGGASSKNTKVVLDFAEVGHVSDTVFSVSVGIRRACANSTNEFSEFLSSHAGVAFSLLSGSLLFLGDDSSVERDRGSSFNVVTGAHDDADSSSLAVLDGLLDSGLKRVLESEDTDSGKSSLNLGGSFLRIVVAIFVSESLPIFH